MFSTTPNKRFHEFDSKRMLFVRFDRVNACRYLSSSASEDNSPVVVFDSRTCWIEADRLARFFGRRVSGFRNYPRGRNALTLIGSAYFGPGHNENSVRHRWFLRERPGFANLGAAPAMLLHPHAFLMFADWLRHETGSDKVLTFGKRLLVNWLSGVYTEGHVSAEALQFRLLVEPVAAQLVSRIWTDSRLEAVAREIVAESPALQQIKGVGARPREQTDEFHTINNSLAAVHAQMKQLLAESAQVHREVQSLIAALAGRPWFSRLPNN